jgi:ribosomal-protein-alanine N-acetyltransferase
MKTASLTFPNLSTERLELRQLLTSDAAEVFRLRSDAQVNRYIDRPKANSIEDAREFINKILHSPSDQSVYWAISLRREQKLIGAICVWNISKEDSRAEIGYELLPDYHGQGIMQEAMTAVIDHGFRNMGLRSIVAVLHPENIKSVKLLERNNFLINTEQKDQLENMVVYSLTK